MSYAKSIFSEMDFRKFTPLDFQTAKKPKVPSTTKPEISRKLKQFILSIRSGTNSSTFHFPNKRIEMTRALKPPVRKKIKIKTLKASIGISRAKELNEIWLAYFSSVYKKGCCDYSTLDLHGSLMKVLYPFSESNNEFYTIQETKKLFIGVDNKTGELKKTVKKDHIFEVVNTVEILIVFGNNCSFTSAERSFKRVKDRTKDVI